MIDDKLDAILGYAHLAAAALNCYALNLRGMLPGKEKDKQLESLENMVEQFEGIRAELLAMIQAERGE